MMRKYLPFAAGSLLLMTGWGTASAAPLITVGPNGVEGFFSTTGFSPGASSTPGPNTQNFTMSFDFLSGSSGGLGIPNNPPTTLSFTSQSGPTVDLFSTNLDLKFDPSPNVNDPHNPSYTPSPDTRLSQVISWNGSAAVDSGLANLTFGDINNNNGGLVGDKINISYNGFSILGQSFTGAGSLVLTVANPTDFNTITFSGVDTCTSGNANNPPNVNANVCFTRALTLIDLNTSNIGTIDGVFFVPEPTSWALLGIGLAGLGVTRRQKKAA